MDEINLHYRGLREASQEKRASNREFAVVHLKENQIPFTVHNEGAHLIVEGPDCYIDFWPGTGKLKTRKGEAGFGIRNLVKFITGGN